MTSLEEQPKQSYLNGFEIQEQKERIEEVIAMIYRLPDEKPVERYLELMWDDIEEFKKEFQKNHDPRTANALRIIQEQYATIHSFPYVLTMGELKLELQKRLAFLKHKENQHHQ